MAWWDVRLKVIGESAVVELRSLPTQPEWEDEIALTAAYIGMLGYCDSQRTQFMPIEHVAYNRMQAMQYGLSSSGRLWLEGELVNPSRAVAVWLDRAEEGLKFRGLPDATVWLERLRVRLQVGCPSQQLAEALGHDPHPTRKRLMAAMEACRMIW